MLCLVFLRKGGASMMLCLAVFLGKRGANAPFTPPPLPPTPLTIAKLLVDATFCY